MIGTSVATPALNSDSTQLFYYRNTTSQVQIVRLDQVLPRFEKVVFPGERLLFYATSMAFLDIYTSPTPDLMLTDRISCAQLLTIETE